MCSSNQRKASRIAPATTATPISPYGRYWKCTFHGKYAFSTPSIVTAILQVMPPPTPPSGNNVYYWPLPPRLHHSFKIYPNSISKNICTPLCCALFCCGDIVSNCNSVLLIYLCSWLIFLGQSHYCHSTGKVTQIAKFMGPTLGPPGSCWPQMGPMLVSWTLLSGYA